MAKRVVKMLELLVKVEQLEQFSCKYPTRSAQLDLAILIMYCWF